ncbi:MAG: DUF6351 family protein [Actinomycetota bacterium]
MPIRNRPRTSIACLLATLPLLAAPLVAVPAAGTETEPQAEPATGQPPVQYPFACTAQDHGLELIVDNQEGEGVEVRDDDGELLGYSRDCEAETRTWYYAVDRDGDRHIIRDHDEGPVEDIEQRLGDAALAKTTLTDGREVPYLIRHERGVINRFIYSVSMLATTEEVTGGTPDQPDRSNWNGRLLYQFQGGVGIGHTQGEYDERGITGAPDRLGMGYAVVYSTGTRTGEHYNLLLGGRTAQMVKDHFVATHGEPDYTVGLGGSGGAIQQYVYAQNHPDLLDALVPQRSYPDMTTQTIHVGDCALLDRWMDLEADDAGFWANWDNRKLLQGMNSIEGYLGGNARALNQAKQQLSAQLGIDVPQQTGSSECVEGWLGLLPLAMNPHFGSETNWDLLGDQADDIERTHWDDAREVYGTDPDTGFARVPWDNVGVQYGLQAVADGEIAPEQFLEVNAEVGSWKDTAEMVPEGVPFEDLDVVVGRIAAERGITPDQVFAGLASGTIPFTELFDPWSARNADLSPDGGVTPAPRRSGDLAAIRGAYESGLVFRGELPQIPIIDIRDYLEPVLDMHNSHQSFAARQRLIDAQGHHDGQVIWFLEADESGDAPAAEQLTHQALDTVAEWMANLEDDPTLTVAEAAPEHGVDRCVGLDGREIAAGDGVWDGILDDGPDGECAERFEPFTTSRIEAGGPISGDIYKCHLMPVRSAAVEDLYGAWEPAADELDRLEAIFPDGVCDYDLPSVGDPEADVAAAPDVVHVGRNLLVIGEPAATVELRAADEVVLEAGTNAAGLAVLTRIPAGTYVVRQVVNGEPGLRTEPVEVQ